MRYVDQDLDANNKTSADKGIFSKLFSSGSSSDKAKTAQRYQVSVKGAAESSRIVVLNDKGGPESSPTADKILSLLTDQLK